MHLSCCEFMLSSVRDVECVEADPLSRCSSSADVTAITAIRINNLLVGDTEAASAYDVLRSWRIEGFCDRVEFNYSSSAEFSVLAGVLSELN